MAEHEKPRCSVCGRGSRRRGLCDAHYTALRRTEQNLPGGDPQAEVIGAMASHLRSLAGGMDNVARQLREHGRACRRAADFLDKGV